MAAPGKWKAIEEDTGKPIVELLTELYERYGNQTRVAAELNVSQGTVSLWLDRCGLKEKTIVVPRKDDSASNCTSAVQAVR